MTDSSLFDVIDKTWPAARMVPAGPWTLRDGQGGGKRVSAATANDHVQEADVPLAEAGLADLGQPPLFLIRDGDAALDAMLQVRGYSVLDPVTAYACPVAELTNTKLPRVTVFEIWEPLSIMLEIWQAGGIGLARVDVMRRATDPKISLLGRLNEHPAAAAFVAIHDGTAMVHAIEILEHQRRQGMGGWIMRAAAFWAAKHGAHTVSALCTDANEGANRLYTSLGMSIVGHYHYCHLTEQKDNP
jgi:GNAT superfamily N-acetyltransferase